MDSRGRVLEELDEKAVEAAAKELKKLGPVRIIPLGRVDLASADLERQ